MTRLQAALARGAERPLVIPFLTAGYPELEVFELAVSAMAEAGADIIEIGMPFSDPLADGPTIQRASARALSNGVTTAWTLDAVRRLRGTPATATVPLLLMGYVNPLLRYGLDRFVADAAAAGADGLIVPDLPPEEAGELRAACVRSGLAMAFLCAPNASDERVRLVDAASTDFSYCVALTGVTGARGAVHARTVEFLQRVGRLAGKPFVVGFGVKDPEHVRILGPWAVGVVVGSALIDAMDAAAEPVTAASTVVGRLRQAAAGVRRHTGIGSERHNIGGGVGPAGQSWSEE